MLETFLTSIPAFLFALGAIVLVHEAGHYLVAKLFGVRVNVFSIGFGPRLVGFEAGGTEYRLAWIPLGGYVAMAGQLPEERSGRDDDFLSKPRWQRILIYLAGPAANVVLAVALIAGVFTQGFEVQALQQVPAVVGMVLEDSPAEAAGLRPGDRILSVAGEPVERWQDVAFEISVSPEKPLELRVERGGGVVDTVLTPEKVPRDEYGDAGVFPQIQLRVAKVMVDTPAERAGFRAGDEVLRVDDTDVVATEDFVDYVSSRPGVAIEVEVARRGKNLVLPVVPEDIQGRGVIGVQLGPFRPLPLGEALVESVRFNVEVVEKSVVIISRLMRNQISAKSTLSGPIEIANYSGRAARRSFRDLLFFMGFLSISIAFMNLLPIPILDGGHISILLVESAMRRDLSLVLKERITQLGFVMLMMLMAMVIFFDLSKNVPALFS